MSTTIIFMKCHTVDIIFLKTFRNEGKDPWKLVHQLTLHSVQVINPFSFYVILIMFPKTNSKHYLKLFGKNANSLYKFIFFNVQEKELVSYLLF